MTKLMTKDEAFKTCDTIAKQGALQDNRIQRAAVTAVGYSIFHGDITIAQRLIEVFPKGNKLVSLVAFMEEHGNLAWDKSAGTVRHIKDADREVDTTKDIEVLLTECANMQWHEYGPKSTPKSKYDIAEDLAKYLKRMQKKVADSTVEVEHAELLEKLAAIL